MAEEQDNAEEREDEREEREHQQQRYGVSGTVTGTDGALASGLR